MKPPKTVRRIIETLATQHPNADTELVYRNAFELLAATILSAQSTDARVNMVTPALFARAADARAMAKLTAAQILPYIRSCGLAPGKHTLKIKVLEEHDKTRTGNRLLIGYFMVAGTK